MAEKTGERRGPLAATDEDGYGKRRMSRETQLSRERGTRVLAARVTVEEARNKRDNRTSRSGSRTSRWPSFTRGLCWRSRVAPREALYGDFERALGVLEGRGAPEEAEDAVLDVMGFLTGLGAPHMKL